MNTLYVAIPAAVALAALGIVGWYVKNRKPRG